MNDEAAESRGPATTGTGPSQDRPASSVSSSDGATAPATEPPTAALEPDPEPPTAALEPDPEPPTAALEPDPEPPTAALEPDPGLRAEATEPIPPATGPAPEPLTAETEPPAPDAQDAPGAGAADGPPPPPPPGAGPTPPGGAVPPGGGQVPPTPPPWFGGADGGPTFAKENLIRPTRGRYVAGVCAALGRATNTDPVLWRVLLAVMGFFGGVGVLIYLIGWLVIPAENDTASPIESLLGRGRSAMAPFSIVLLAGAAVLTFAFVVNDGFRAALLAAAVLIGATLLLKRNAGSANAYPPGGPTTHPAGTPTAGTSGFAAAGTSGFPAASTSGFSAAGASAAPPSGPSASPADRTHPAQPSSSADPTAAFATTPADPATTFGTTATHPTAAFGTTPADPTAAFGTTPADPTAAFGTTPADPTAGFGTTATDPTAATASAGKPVTAPLPPLAPEPPMPSTAGAGTPPLAPRPPSFPPPKGGYRAPFAPHGPWAGATLQFPAPRPRPPKPPKPPREKSKLGRITFFGVVMVLGVLAMVDTAGFSMPVSAYFAAALATVSLGLIVGAWFGRARGLIALALVAAFGLGISSGVERFGGQITNSVYRPQTVPAVADRYDFTLGNVTLDLRKVDFTGAQQETYVEMRAGQVKVLLPENVDTTADVRMNNGRAYVFGRESDGRSIDGQTLTDLGADGAGGGSLHLIIEMNAGNVEVIR